MSSSSVVFREKKVQQQHALQRGEHPAKASSSGRRLSSSDVVLREKNIQQQKPCLQVNVSVGLFKDRYHFKALRKIHPHKLHICV